ncbi:MAG: methyltransferase domain-containing protein [Candidatus Sericytochromatia bacterium]
MNKFLWNLKRQFGYIDKMIIQDYFNTQDRFKLHIGCGSNTHNDWLNSDYFPESNKILHLDATEVFPFSSGTFDYIFSEHMIEHISYSQGFNMLNECYRILTENGKIRISTPDFKFLNDLYIENKSDLQKEYIKWSIDNFIQDAPYYDSIFVINNFVRDWGHLFIYDEKTLRLLLEKAGFSKIVRCNLNESEDIELQDLENINRLPKGFLKLESITLEATRLKN